MANEAATTGTLSPKDELQQLRETARMANQMNRMIVRSSRHDSGKADAVLTEVLSAINQYLRAMPLPDAALDKERATILAENIALGEARDPTFRAREEGPRAQSAGPLEPEHGETVALGTLELRAIEANNIARRVEASTRKFSIRVDTRTSGDILKDAVTSADRSAASIHTALVHDIERRHERRASGPYRSPGSGTSRLQKRSPERMQARHLRDARMESISRAVEAVRQSGETEAATIALARALASDRTLRGAFTQHAGFQRLVQSVDHPGLNALRREVEAWPERDHPLTLPGIALELRREREARSPEGRSRRAPGEDRATLRSHQHYTGRFDSSRSVHLSSYALSTRLKRLTRLEVPEGPSVDLLHNARFSPGELNTIRENLHRARLMAAREDPTGELKAFIGEVPVKITEDTNWRSRVSSSRKNDTRVYAEGAGEISRDATALYIHPSELLAESGAEALLARARATLAQQQGRDSLYAVPSAASSGVSWSPPPAMADLTKTSLETEKWESRSAVTSIADTTGTVSLAEKREPVVAPATPPPLTPAPVKVGDVLTFTTNCDAAEMLAGDVVTVTAVDPAAHRATVRNDAGEEGQFNYKEFHGFTLGDATAVEKETPAAEEKSVAPVVAEKVPDGADVEKTARPEVAAPPAGESGDPPPPKVGDRLILTADCPQAELLKGDVVTVTAVDPSGHLAKVENEYGEDSEFSYKEFRDFQHEGPAVEQARAGHDGDAEESARPGSSRGSKLHALTSQFPPYQSTARAAMASEPDLSKTRPGVNELYAQRPAAVHGRV